MNDSKQIGFSQRIQLEWLERTAELVRGEVSTQEIQAELQTLLRNRLSVGGSSLRGNREKAITILLKTWVKVRKDLAPFRDSGLRLIAALPSGNHLPIHWAMAMSAYPFFGKVAEITGRLLDLQGTVTTAQVSRRLREFYGERETIDRAGRRVLRCFVDWGVLQDADKRGLYHAAPKLSVEDARLALFLVEAVLHSTGVASIGVSDAVRFPSLFPFSLENVPFSLFESNGRLHVYRQGLDEEVVGLQQSR